MSCRIFGPIIYINKRKICLNYVVKIRIICNVDNIFQIRCKYRRKGRCRLKLIMGIHFHFIRIVCKLQLNAMLDSYARGRLTQTLSLYVFCSHIVM